MRRTVTGLRAWLVQRLSAVYVLVFILFFLSHFVLDSPRSFIDWHSWLTSTAVSVATAVFFVALLAHSWVGVRDVILDYVRPVGLRLGLLTVLVFSLTATALWVAQVLWTARTFPVI